MRLSLAVALLLVHRTPFQFRRNWSGFDWHILSDKIISLTFGQCYDVGGDDGNRTHDPLLAGQVLSQLSYTPMILGLLSCVRFPGIEPDDHRLRYQVLSQLSYTPITLGSVPSWVKLSKIIKAFRLSDPRKLNNKRSVQRLPYVRSRQSTATDP